MDTNILEEIGLTKTEIKIYLALLKLGQSTTTPLIKEAEVPASKVYEFLEKLIQKGLVSYVIKSNKKYFTALEPKSLKHFLNEKKRKIEEQEKEVDKLVPELNLLVKEGKEDFKAEIYESLNGVKSIYERILSTLNKGEIQYIIGAPRIGNEQIEGFLLDWHERRIKKGIHCKYIYDSNVRDYGKVREAMKYTSVRYLPHKIASPVWIEIAKDIVTIGHIKGSNAVIFLIKDKEIANSYLDYFNLIWKVSEKRIKS